MHEKKVLRDWSRSCFLEASVGSWCGLPEEEAGKVLRCPQGRSVLGTCVASTAGYSAPWLPATPFWPSL